MYFRAAIFKLESVNQLPVIMLNCLTKSSDCN